MVTGTGDGSVGTAHQSLEPEDVEVKVDSGDPRKDRTSKNRRRRRSGPSRGLVCLPTSTKSRLSSVESCAEGVLTPSYNGRSR